MGKKVLLVEDYEDARLFMKILLEGYDFEVTEAVDGLEAVTIIKQRLPDLVLMDIAMPVMDGLTATRAIRKFERCSKIPIIAVTAHGKHLYEMAIAAGCNDVIAKPIDFQTFEPLLNQYLEQ
jgi:CheY-like chemotaxis protein